MDNGSANKFHFSLTVLLSLCYLSLIIFLGFHHEMWRDEVRALSIATSSSSFLVVLDNLGNEGHPALWYVLLYVAHSLFPSPSILPVLSIGIAFLAAIVFLRYSPFPLPIRIIWLLGFYPIYEYSVSCRNYGIGMLLLWCFLALFSERWRSPFLLAIILSLLSLTNVYGWLLSVSISISLIVEILLAPGKLSQSNIWKILLSGVLFITAALLSALEMLPDSNSEVLVASTDHLSRLGQAVVASLISLGSVFHNAFYLPFPWAVPLIIILLSFALIRTPSSIALLFAVVIGMELLHRLVHSGLALRHQGHLLLTVVAVIWMDGVKEPEILGEAKWLNKLASIRTRLLNFALLILLLIQMYSGAKAVGMDLKHPMSSAIQVANFIKANKEYANAILMVEPDYAAEALPYYIENRIFFPREDAFKKTVSFTSVASFNYSLSEMLAAASSVSEQEHVDILLLLPPELISGRRIESLYKRSFVLDERGLQLLRNKGKLLAVFSDSPSDENYGVWLWRPDRYVSEIDQNSSLFSKSPF